MLRVLTSALWILVTAAFGFDAVAQPCEIRMALETPTEQAEMTGMPCHDDMAHTPIDTPDEQPAQSDDACCCVALLTNVLTVNPIDLAEPWPGVTQWAGLLPDTARTLSLEYEPPPPRA